MNKITYLGLNIHSTEEFDWVDADEIPDEYKPSFMSWMNGQTAPFIPGHNAIYRWDFERWYKMTFQNIPTYFD